MKFAALITALGIGIKVDSDDDAEGGESSSKFDLSKLRYDRIIIMTDADVDGRPYPNPAADILFQLHAAT